MPVRPETAATCAECEPGTALPFTPNQGSSPVLCCQSFQKTQSQSDPATLQHVDSTNDRPAGVVIPFRAAKRKLFAPM